jgi:ribosome recycling factor
MKINQLANIQVLDARTVTIKPYDRNLISEVAKSINNSNLKVNPQVNPDNIKIIFQPPTEENRKLNVKNAKQYYEQAKTKIKNIRQDVRKKYKSIDGLSEDLIRNFDEELDKITKLYNSKLEKIFNDKEEELMKI